jgi:hypothetical protein
MLRLLLFRFWPVFIPLVAYWLWWRFVGSKATIEGKPAMRFRDGPWYWAVLSSLLLAVVCFIFLGGEAVQGTTGDYIPPHMENGQVVPGQVAKP